MKTFLKKFSPLLVLLICMMLALTFAACNPDDDGENTPQQSAVVQGVKLELSADGSHYTVTGYERTGAVLSLPSSHSGVEVRKIDQEAFLNNETLTQLTVPNTIKTIGNSAFKGCNNLESITLPFVGQGVLENSYFGYIFGASTYTEQDEVVPQSLKSVILTGGSYIRNNAFYDCENLVSVTIPETVTAIGDSAFYGCSKLQSIVIPDSVESIGSFAFAYCSAATKVTIGSNLTNIPDTTSAFYAFEDCSMLGEFVVADSNPAYTTQEGILYNKAKTEIIIVPKRFYGTVNIPDGVTKIGFTAFGGCIGLQGVVIPDSVTSIAERAFGSCTWLRWVKMGDGVETIGHKAFADCERLEKIIIGSGLESIGLIAFENCTKVTSVFYKGADWTELNSISGYNVAGSPLLDAATYYYSETENTDGSHWHYVDGEPSIWQ